MSFTTRELNLLSTTDVLGYIQAENAKRNAQAVAEGWEFWTVMSEDLAEEFANAYELELMFARGTYADVHKDWCGRKGYVSDELTLEQVESEIEWLTEANRRADWVAALAEDIREEYWADLEREEEEMRRLQEQRAAEEAEDILWEIQDRLMAG